MVDKKTISQIIAIKVTIVVIFIFLVLPIYPFETQIVCVTEPCPSPVDLKSGIDLIRESQEPTACIQIFDPVCGVDGITYSNQCFADNAGVLVAFKGNCN